MFIKKTARLKNQYTSVQEIGLFSCNKLSKKHIFAKAEERTSFFLKVKYLK